MQKVPGRVCKKISLEIQLNSHTTRSKWHFKSFPADFKGVTCKHGLAPFARAWGGRGFDRGRSG